MLYKTMPMALLSLIPSVGICIFVYFKDKKEKEPLWLLASLFAVSAAVYVPVYYLGRGLINGIFDSAFRSTTHLGTGMTSWASPSSETAHHVLCATVGIAIVEEAVRWLILYFFTNKSRYFNCTFDGVVYSVVVSMGAALAGNLRYAVVDGWDQFLYRFLHSFPWYLLFGIVMGVFFALWHTRRRANRTENRLIDEGKLKKDKLRYPIGTLLLSLAVPIALHAVYSYVFEQLRSRSPMMNLAFYIVAAVMMAVCVVLIIVLSRRDRSEREAIEEIIEEEHGDLPDEYYDTDPAANNGEADDK